MFSSLNSVLRNRVKVSSPSTKKRGDTSWLHSVDTEETRSLLFKPNRECEQGSRLPSEAEFRATLAAYGSEARGLIGATAADYTPAIATWDPSCIYNPHHSSRQCQILNPLSEARDQTATSCFLVRFVSAVPWWELQIFEVLKKWDESFQSFCLIHSYCLLWDHTLETSCDLNKLMVVFEELELWMRKKCRVSEFRWKHNEHFSLVTHLVFNPCKTV